MNEIKYKKFWKESCYFNGEFSSMKALRGQVLDYWDIYRVIMPRRNYEKYPVNRRIKNDSIGKKFYIIIMKRELLLNIKIFKQK